MIIVSSSFISWGQNWRDSLSAAHTAYKEGKFKEAQEKFVRAQRLAPEGVDLSKDIGTSAYRSGDYSAAEKAFHAALDKSSSSEEKSRKWHNIGNAQVKQKNYQGAVDSYKEALRENPSDEKARYNLAEAKRRLKKQEEEQQQNQQQDQDQQNSQDDQNQNQNPQNQNHHNQNQQGQQTPSNSQNQSSQNSQGGRASSSEAQKLSSKKTERMLDELMKKEMETKRRMHGMGSGGEKEQVKSGKRW